MNCQVEGCNNKAHFSLYRTLNGEKKWIHVCSDCEKKIGDENIQNKREV